MNAPISGLDPVSGHRLWSLFQFLLVVIACGVVAIVAPWPKRTPRLLPVAATLVALAGAGTLPMLTEGQELGTITLGLALAYAAWRSDAKPHLALGLVAFMAGWRDRRIVAGALVGALVAGSLSVMAVGWTACLAFIETAIRSNNLYPHAQLLGFNGVFATWFNDGVAATVLGDICSVAALGLAVALGTAVRRDRSRLGPALIGATLLSLLASPHTFSHDLTLLAPMLVLAVAEAARGSQSAEWPARPTRRVLAVWLLIIAACGIDSSVALPAALGRLSPFALMVGATIAAKATWPSRPSRADFGPTVQTQPRATYAQYSE